MACGRSLGFFLQRGLRFFARRFLAAATCAWPDFFAFLRLGFAGVHPGLALRRLRFRLRAGLAGALTLP